MGKVVVITGASSGLGKELAKIYLEKGYRLVLNDINQEGFNEFENKADIKLIIGDLTKQETIDKIYNAAKDFGRIDILVNNAGITYIQPFEKNTPEQLDKILAIDLRAPILLTHKIYPLMVKQQSGTVININSTAGKEGKANHTMYCAVKFGLAGFTQSFRLEAKKHGIRVLSIHPGGINTPFYDSLEEKVDSSGYMDPKALAKIIVNLSQTEGLSPDEILINRLSK